MARDLLAGRWVVPPDLTLSSSELVCPKRPILFGETPRLAKAVPKMLLQFVDLAEEDEKSILEYARRFGPLGSCEHVLPVGHSIPILLQEFARHLVGLRSAENISTGGDIMREVSVQCYA
jgi:hypothetical protein